ncbi:MAG: GNAT family protein [Betaproteobacteria bacterium]
MRGLLHGEALHVSSTESRRCDARLTKRLVSNRVCSLIGPDENTSVPLTAPPQIECPRLLLRLVVQADLPALLEVNNKDEVTRFLPYATWNSINDAEAWYQRMSDQQASGTALQFVIEDRRTRTPIGTCLLFRLEETSARAEVGYVLTRSHWGMGYMREALGALIDCAFGRMSLRRIEAEVDPRNAASGRLLLHLGFVKEGLLRQRWVAKGEAKDVEIYGLLRHEWRNSTGGASV